ncbi:hypothetical protein MCW_01203 [Cardidatus Bartonella washoeensis 085-0475]|uniref:Uncharacterized protein n=1 Tax=Cardidatus Bartonella washoeensis 085-0475 TaxID=1094564 RepID=J1JJL2_9HYPH|nr:hypothetical protein MCW_01203 [Bartonella washoeensis 085-0475]
MQKINTPLALLPEILAICAVCNDNIRNMSYNFGKASLKTYKLSCP